MENNDQNPTQPAPQEENPQCDPASTDSSCCSAGSSYSKGWKTVILIVVLLLGGAVASRSLLQNGTKSPCCPASGDSSQCPKGLGNPECDQTKTTACTETKSACSPGDSKGCPSDNTACDKAKTCPTAETKIQGCPTGEKAAASPCCPSATSPDSSPKNLP